MRDKNPLIGQVIAAIQISGDRQALRFILADGKALEVNTDAGCCSYTWIEHVELPALGFPAFVTAVDDLDMGPDTQDDYGAERSTSNHKPAEHHTGGEYIRYYGCKISTDRGEIVIDYRNDSNGYYGGNLSWPGDHHYGGVYGQNAADGGDWQPVETAL